MGKVKYDNNLAKEVRMKSIGGSDASSILGLNNYKSAIDLWLEKTGQKEPDDLSENEFVYWGTRLEDIVAEEFAKRADKKVRRNNYVLHHPDYDFISANLDREVVGEDAILECKTTNAYAYKEWEGDEIPMSYLVQVQHYLIVTGKSVGYIAVLIGGNKFAWKKVERDEELIEMMIDKYIAFWECVKTNTIPDVEEYGVTEESLKILYPEGNDDDCIELRDNKLVADIQLVKEQFKAIEKEKKELENKLKFSLGESNTAMSSEWKVTWKSQSRSSVDATKLKAEKPKIYEKYLKESSSRVLRIKKLG